MQNVIAELHPAEVTTPDGRFYRKAKVLLTDDGVIVLEQTGSDIAIVFAERHVATPVLPDMRRSTRQQYLEAYTQHGTLRANGAHGCSCTDRILQRFTIADVHAMATAGEPL